MRGIRKKRLIGSRDDYDSDPDYTFRNEEYVELRAGTLRTLMESRPQVGEWDDLDDLLDMLRQGNPPYWPDLLILPDGRRTFVWKENPPVSLFVLPRELRDQISGLVLPEPRIVDITTYAQSYLDTFPSQRVLTGDHNHLAYRQKMKQDQFWDISKRVISRRSKPINILLASKEISSEALEILYSSNRFELSRHRDTKAFVRCIGAGSKFLPIVDLSDPSLRGLKNSLEHLKVATQLQTVYLHRDFILQPNTFGKGEGESRNDHLTWSCQDWYASAATFYKTVRDFLATMKVSYRHDCPLDREPRKALDIFQIRPGESEPRTT